jgi:predicted lipoprotein with Yx(FWY)xxD motif
VTRILLTAVAVLALALAVVACGGGDEEPAARQPATERTEDATREREPAGEPEEPPGTEISASQSQLGPALFDGDDQAIYYFQPEGASEPRCYGSCAAAWPPVLTDGQPTASGAARQRLLGTTQRRDGSIQVTYDGRPLYYYAHEDPGELRCHNIHHEGGLWLAVRPSGEPVPHEPGETVFLDGS